jgi:hypothetical protein
MRELRFILKALSWMAETLWLGLRASCDVLRLAVRVPRALRTELRCPRGHAVSVYGTYKCGHCGAEYDGAAFAPCPSCGSLARYLPCRRCGLAVKDPWA